ncbi:MAG: ribonuclease VapC [Thermoleophilaceae bacterium]|nr:ribonuclease VapC [Thermoleophilaceae bacterium]
MLTGMPSKTTLKGRTLDSPKPNWQPLLNLLAGDFMWMFDVELEDGRCVHAYKHYVTRRYIHIADDDTAFVYADRSRYEEVDPEWLLEEVLEGYDRRTRRLAVDDDDPAP